LREKDEMKVLSSASCDQREEYEFRGRFVGFSEEQEKILVIAADHDTFEPRRTDRVRQWVRNRALYLHSILISPCECEKKH